MFKTILKEELLLNRKEVDYEIILKTNEIKLLSLIFIRLKKQYIVKKYLKKILRKN